MNGKETTNEEKMKFYQLLTKHTKSSLLYDQINKKFGDEIYQLHDKGQKNVAKFIYPRT